MPIERIEALDDERLADYRHVPDPELLRRGEIFVAEGRLVVRTLLTQSRYRARSILLTEAALGGLADVIESRLADTPVFVVPASAIEGLTGFDIHRGCLAIGERPERLNSGADAGAPCRRHRGWWCSSGLATPTTWEASFATPRHSASMPWSSALVAATHSTARPSGCRSAPRFVCRSVTPTLAGDLRSAPGYRLHARRARALRRKRRMSDTWASSFRRGPGRRSRRCRRRRPVAGTLSLADVALRISMAPSHRVAQCRHRRRDRAPSAVRVRA